MPGRRNQRASERLQHVGAGRVAGVWARRHDQPAPSPDGCSAGPLATLARMRTGTSTGGIETSKRWHRKQAKKRRAEEAKWADQSGPVLLRIGDHEIYVKSQAKRDMAAARRLLLDAIAAGAPPGTVRPPT
jgi:hypothetical protein